MSSKAKAKPTFNAETFTPSEEQVPLTSLPTFWETVSGIVAGALACCGLMALTQTVVDALAVGLLALTGWGALAYAFWFVFTLLGMLASIYASSAVVGYVANRNAIRDARDLSTWTKGKLRTWFSRDPSAATVH